MVDFQPSWDSLNWCLDVKSKMSFFSEITKYLKKKKIHSVFTFTKAYLYATVRRIPFFKPYRTMFDFCGHLLLILNAKLSMTEWKLGPRTEILTRNPWRFSFNQNFRKNRNEDKWYRNFQKLFNFEKRTINPKIPELPGGKLNGTEIPGKKFPNTWVYLARLSFFPENSAN